MGGGACYRFRNAEGVDAATLAEAVLAIQAVPPPLDDTVREPEVQPLAQDLENRCRKVITSAMSSLEPALKQTLSKRMGQLKKEFVQEAVQRDKLARAAAEDESSLASAEDLTVSFLALCRHLVSQHS